MTQPITRKPQLTPEQAARLEATGETEGTIRKAPWYLPLQEWGFKTMGVMLGALALFVFNNYNDAQKSQASATGELVKGVNTLNIELVRQRTQLESLAESMRLLSNRQDIAIATAERTAADQTYVTRRVDLLQYYVLEFDGKLIAAGIVKPADSVALKLRKEQEKRP